MTTSLTQQFLKALISNEAARFDTCLHQDATLRIHGYSGLEIHRSQNLIVERLTAESADWPDPTVEIFTQHATDNKTAVEFRIQATENGRYVEHNRAAFLTIADERIKTIDLYCPEPLPSGHRKNYIASADLTDEELGRLFDTNLFHHDVRNGVPPGVSGRLNLRRLRIERSGPHPTDNSILGIRWTAEAADANIQAIIGYHQEKNISFIWTVSSYDTPSDLAQRLEKHGLVLAGEQALMALTNLETLDIPTNPALQILPLDTTDDDQIEAAYQIISISFRRSQEQIEKRRAGFIDLVKNGGLPNYLAYLNGRPVGHGRIDLSGSTAHLSGAATLPDYRGQGIYSTLLRYRLEAAREFGHQIATIDAQPMSKGIVARYGFKEFANSLLYAWMPIIDMDVINTLIQRS